MPVIMHGHAVMLHNIFTYIGSWWVVIINRSQLFSSVQQARFDLSRCPRLFITSVGIPNSSRSSMGDSINEDYDEEKIPRAAAKSRGAAYKWYGRFI
jgi:hypothetical protein